MENSFAPSCAPLLHALEAGWRRAALAASLVIALVAAGAPAAVAAPSANSKHGFVLEEATIDEIQTAILSNKITVTDIVERYLERIKAYNGTCVNQPEGILGPISTIANSPKINALITLNLRPAAREAWGFDARKARSLTDSADTAATMPDALEVAAAQDRELARTGRLVGPLHGVVMAIKDQYYTFDMRTTSGADAQ